LAFRRRTLPRCVLSLRQFARRLLAQFLQFLDLLAGLGQTIFQSPTPPKRRLPRIGPQSSVWQRDRSSFSPASEKEGPAVLQRETSSRNPESMQTRKGCNVAEG